MEKNKDTNVYYTYRQLKLPLEIEKIIDASDPVYTFCDVMDRIDLSGYFADMKGCKTGRPKCDPETLLRIILFAFMEHGYCSLRDIEKLCKTDIRYMYLLNGTQAPSFATFGNFIRDELTDTIEQIFVDVNRYIFEKDHVDLNHAYIDGTKIEANANKYTWVWKKSCIKNRDKVFGKVTELLDSINSEVLNFLGLKFETREEYAIEYLESLLGRYEEVTKLDKSKFMHGIGHRKSLYCVLVYDETRTNVTKPEKPAKKTVRAPYIKLAKTVGLGKSFTLNVTNVSDDAKVSYTSSDESVAKVNKKGVITAVGTGKCTVVGIIKQNETAYKFAVAITVKKTTSGSRKLKEKECLTPNSLTPLLNIYRVVSTKNPLELNIKRLAEDAVVTYSSEDESIATVSEDGIITGLKKGYTGINVYVRQNGTTCQYRIYVRVSTGK